MCLTGCFIKNANDMDNLKVTRMVNKRALITTIKDEGGEKRTEFLAMVLV